MKVSAGRTLSLVSLLYLHHYVLVRLATADPSGKRCNRGGQSTCVCHTPKGTVDLTTISESDGTSARYSYRLIACGSITQLCYVRH